ncbi:hypothetical protein [Phenylobacterium sp.]|uniref:hypothetical protein n=1 Tax=Phenylobacterium sp. TaxID=1871053 RepID=UPI003BAA6D4E
MPNTFVVVEWDSGEAHEAQAVWFKAAEVGIEILRSCDLRDRVPHVFAEAKAAWLLTPQAQGAGL